MKNLLILILLFTSLSPVVKGNVSGSKDPAYLIQKANSMIDYGNDSCMIYINQLKELSSREKNKLLMVQALSLEGDYLTYLKNDYNSATQIYLQAIGLSEKNELNFEKNIYLSLGRLFHMTDNYEKAELYYKKALVFFKRDSDTLQLVKCLLNLGTVNSSTGRFMEAESFLLESLHYSSPFEIRRAAYSNLGNLKIREKKYAEALIYLKKAVEVNPETGAGGDILDYSYLLNAKAGSGNFAGMDSVILHSQGLIHESTDLRRKTIMLKAIGEAYFAMGDYRKAAQTKDRYIILYDSLKAQQRDEVVYEMETKYQTQKKEEEIALRESEKDQLKRQKQNLILLIIASVGVILLLSYLIYLNIRQKRILKLQTEQLAVLVEEKNILMKETHHRVKNSFQLVSGLLYLQAENISNKEASAAITDAQNRVKSMILIHQKMYSRDQLTGIETREYISDLVKDIIENQADVSKNIRFSTQAESLIFSIETITSIGLILNELIVNSLKHAFNETVLQPEISVLFTVADKTCTLVVKDNGIGMKTETGNNSFGMKLIKSLVKKLKGNMSLKNEQGTSISIEFPLPETRKNSR